MILLNIDINNMYGIDELKYDLTYKRKTPSSPIIQNLKDFPKINYKKINIIMGANASGKTSLGKSLCYIQNFLFGRTIVSEEGLLSKAQYRKDKDFGFKALFYTDGYVYETTATFDESNLVSEKWKKIKLTPTMSNSVLKARIENSDYFYIYNKNEGSKILYEHKSSFLSNTQFKEDHDLIRANSYFYYRFSGQQYDSENYKSIVDLDFFKKILQSFDPSIKSVDFSKDTKSVILIKFNNGVTERLTDGILDENSVLSSGTKESIALAKILFEIYHNDKEGLYFLDEQMAFSHADMEAAIVQLILNWIDQKEVQVFITTHNSSLLDIDLPVFNYTFLKRNTYSNKIEMIKPEDEVVHQSRSLKTIIEKDVFSISPALENLLELILD